MNDYYQTLQAVHVGCVMASGGLFLLRYVLTALRVNWRKSFALRIMPHVVDSVLLASAVMLCIVTKQYPFVNGWLTVKVFALIAYIGLGMTAMKSERSPIIRRVTFLLAAAVFLFIVTVARTHQPLGSFAQFFK